MSVALLSKECLSHRNQPPKIILDGPLVGKYVRLELLDAERDSEVLWQRSNGKPVSLPSESHCHSIGPYDPEELVWKYMFSSTTKEETLEEYREKQILHLLNLDRCSPFTVFDIPTGSQIGIACCINNFPEHLKLELGCIWYSPVAQRTWANTEATFLLLQYAFEKLKYRRVEWKCDALNERSMAAAKKMGFTFEATQEFHFIYKNRSRDTAWFRILDIEWPSVKDKLLARLS